MLLSRVAEDFAKGAISPFVPVGGSGLAAQASSRQGSI